MVDGIQLKFCGLRTLVDAEMADKLGADFLGFIFHAASPRSITLRDWEYLRPNLPEGRRSVAVVVEPEPAQLSELKRNGFDRFQIHFRAETEIETIAAWGGEVGVESLWLAPKRAPGVAFDERWLKLAQTFLIDAYSPLMFGGSGHTGDWQEFSQLRTRYQDHRWILAGGLVPTNIGPALQASGARMVDVNSGVELSPGIKDHVKMRGLVLAIHRAMEQKAQAERG